MSTSPFGAAGFGFPAFDPAAFERLSRQWASAFGAPAPAPADPFAWWTHAVQPTPPPSADPTAIAQQWMSRMQQLATQFVGRDAGAADIAKAWRAMVGDNPFAQVSGAFVPPPFAAGATRGPFDLPAFGYAREHQERAQAFAKTVAEFQQASQAFNALVAEAGQDAFQRFESLLAKRGTDGKPLETARAMFDLWIDAAEDAYADIALSERFQKAFGEYVNAQTRVRAAMQNEVERASAQWGIPGRAEVDAAHRKVATLERELRRLRDRLDRLEHGASSTDNTATTAPEPPPPAAKKTASKKHGAKGGRR